jgi:acyl carrier protein
MPTTAQVNELISSIFGIPTQDLRDDLGYGDVPQWDSLNHVRLMLALEETFSVTIGEDEMVELTTVKAIRDFVSA